MKVMSKQQIANLRSGQTIYRVCSPNGDDRMLGREIVVLDCCPVGKKHIGTRCVIFTQKTAPRPNFNGSVLLRNTQVLYYNQRFFQTKKKAHQYANALMSSRLLTRQRYPSRKRKQISNLYAQ